MRAMRDARLAFAAGLAFVAVAVAVVLSRAPVVLTGTNGLEPLVRLAAVPGGGSGCQAGEVLPAHTSAIRISLEASAGPRVAVQVLSGNTVLARGESAAGWLAKVVTIPVAPLARTVRDTTVCFAFAGAYERVSFLGEPTARGGAARTSAGVLAGRMTIEYVRRGSSSWWSLARGVARRMGLGRAWAGTWVVLLVAALMAASVAVASWVTIRESR
jgi:hypothetical protein